jgi:hypothetical protein
MDLKINSNVDRPLWNTFVFNNEFSSPFQSIAFFDFINSTNKFSADVFAVQNGINYTSLIVVTIQKEPGLMGFFSTRGIVYGGPLLLKNDTGSLSLLLSGIRTYYQKKLIYLEIRNYFNYSDYKEEFSNFGFQYIPWLNFKCFTYDETLMKRNISESRLRQIRKALKTGALWDQAKNVEEVRLFYKMLNNLYKHKIKKPLPQEDFFLNAFKSQIFKFLIVYYQQTIIGGIMCALSQKCLYEFYICGMDENYPDQYPSVLATWAAMEFAHLNNIQKFDFHFFCLIFYLQDFVF